MAGSGGPRILPGLLHHANGDGAAPRFIHQNAAHEQRGDAEKVSAPLPFDGRLAEQPQISLIHQGRRLEGGSRYLIAHKTAGQAMQIAINQREEVVPDFGLARAQPRQPLSDGAGTGLAEIIRLWFGLHGGFLMSLLGRPIRVLYNALLRLLGDGAAEEVRAAVRVSFQTQERGENNGAERNGSEFFKEVSHELKE